LIGRTSLRLFRPEEEPPTLLGMGDRVRFVPIPKERF
jgi:inhibitor of KinA